MNHADHAHSHEPASDTEQIALLEYMHHHNVHHLEEFREMAERVRAEGKDRAAELLGETIALLEQADEKLAASIAELKREV